MFLLEEKLENWRFVYNIEEDEMFYYFELFRLQ